MIEENLENFRKAYIGSAKTSSMDFADISPKLGIQSRPHSYAKKTLIVTLSLILLGSSALGAAQAASPGTTLYPLKLLSDDVVNGKQELKVEKRAQEVIDSTDASQKQQDEALRQFQKTLEKTKEEAKQSGKVQQFRQTLENEEDKFKDAQERNPSNHLEEAIKHTENAKGEVQGQKDSPAGGKENKLGNQNHQNQGGDER